MAQEYKPHTPRLKKVDRYVRDLFRDELPDGVKYHDANHTLHPSRGVVAVANNLAVAEKVSERDRELILTAAYFHDTGYIREYGHNEPIAARMAGRILRLIGYKADEIETVKDMILSTDLRRGPGNHLEEILCDADLDNLGREDFFKLDNKLREGRRVRGLDVDDDAKWYRGTLEILRKYPYHTGTQKKLRETGRQKNIKALQDKIEAIESRKKAGKQGKADQMY
jgi:predicted metal-dependent HD superfamily phosphohydrolase